MMVIHYRKLDAWMKIPGTKTGREEVSEKNSPEPRCEFGMAMTRHAPT